MQQEEFDLKFCALDVLSAPCNVLVFLFGASAVLGGQVPFRDRGKEGKEGEGRGEKKRRKEEGKEEGEGKEKRGEEERRKEEQKKRRKS